MLTQDASWSTAWSPDGKWIAGLVRTSRHVHRRDRARSLWSLDGRGRCSIASTGDGAIVSEWTPDGQEPAVVASRSGHRTPHRRAAGTRQHAAEGRQSSSTAARIASRSCRRSRRTGAGSPTSRTSSGDPRCTSRATRRRRLGCRSRVTAVDGRCGPGRRRPLLRRWQRHHEQQHHDAARASGGRAAGDSRRPAGRTEPAPGTSRSRSHPTAASSPSGKTTASSSDHIVVLQNWRAAADAARADPR